MNIEVLIKDLEITILELKNYLFENLEKHCKVSSIDEEDNLILKIT